MSSVDELDLYDHQDGRCGICRRLPDPFQRFDLDHHHASGEIRGYLCSYCNTTIGFLRENSDWMRRAADYLEYPPSRDCWNESPRWWPDSPGAAGHDLRETL